MLTVSENSTLSKNTTEKKSEPIDIEVTSEEKENDSFAVEDMEKHLIKKALEKHNGKRKFAALDLKISERTLYRKIKEYGLDN